MNISFKTSEMLATLSQVNAVVPQRNSLPILSNVMITTRDDRNGGTEAVLQASDTEVWLQMKTSLTSGDDGMAFCINSNDFLKAVKNLDDTDVSMHFDDTRHVVTCNYQNGHFSIPFTGAEDFPSSPSTDTDVTELYISSRCLLESIEKTIFAAGNDELRVIMNGIHFDFFKDYMVTAATDGQKLAKFKTDKVKHEDDTSFGFTLPTKLCSLVKNILSAQEDTTVKISFTNNSVVFTCAYFKITARLIEGRYPNYDSAIPKACNKKATVKRDMLLQAVRRVLPMGNSNSELVQFSFDKGKVTVSAQDFDFSKSAKEEVACEYEGESIDIGFKGSTFLQIISNLDGEEMTIEMTWPSAAAVIYDTDRDRFLSLLMPMLIN